jgi:hypothetical protein
MAKKKPAARADFKDEIRQMENMFCDLVWYARSNPSEMVGAAGRKRVEELYPKQIAALTADGSNWEHGFNSGCLAAFRLVLGLAGSEADAQDARDMFPFLDT